MKEKKLRLMTIGQFATLHQINKKTLMWYDEIGLFKPAVVKENGYRYYTYLQSDKLETILMLRDLNISIPEIQDFFSNRSAESLAALLDEKVTELDQRITQLKGIRKALLRHKSNITDLFQLDIHEISLVQKEEEALAFIEISPETSFDEVIPLMAEEARKYSVYRLHDASYGSLISVDSLKEKEYEAYYGFYMRIPQGLHSKDALMRPAGMYLRAYCKGDWDKLPKRYEEIFAYAEKNAIKLCGNSYEEGVNEIVINQFEEYITKIEIGPLPIA